jgi:hypothetical protein
MKNNVFHVYFEVRSSASFLLVLSVVVCVLTLSCCKYMLKANLKAGVCG